LRAHACAVPHLVYCQAQCPPACNLPHCNERAAGQQLRPAPSTRNVVELLQCTHLSSRQQLSQPRHRLPCSIEHQPLAAMLRPEGLRGAAHVQLGVVLLRASRQLCAWTCSHAYPPASTHRSTSSSAHAVLSRDCSRALAAVVEGERLGGQLPDINLSDRLPPLWPCARGSLPGSLRVQVSMRQWRFGLADRSFAGQPARWAQETEEPLTATIRASLPVKCLNKNCSRFLLPGAAPCGCCVAPSSAQRSARQHNSAPGTGAAAAIRCSLHWTVDVE
jgi:hypothetical protein